MKQIRVTEIYDELLEAELKKPRKMVTIDSVSLASISKYTNIATAIKGRNLGGSKEVLTKLFEAAAQSMGVEVDDVQISSGPTTVFFIEEHESDESLRKRVMMDAQREADWRRRQRSSKQAAIKQKQAQLERLKRELGQE